MRRIVTSLLLSIMVATGAAAQTYSVEYAYDAQGRLTQAVYADTSAITYSYDPAGNITSVKIGAVNVGIEKAGDLPTAFALYPPYPNPFRTSSSVRFDVREATHVRLVVYDLLGRRVNVLSDNRLPRGRHEAILDGRNLASGVYFCEIEMGDFRAIRQVVLVK